MFRLALAKAQAALLPALGRRTVAALPLEPKLGLSLAQQEVGGRSIGYGLGIAACSVACSLMMIRQQAQADGRLPPQEREVALARELLACGVFYSPLTA
mmetsp:Transcript_133582/g.415408  ORF Transcript_133582/g.415408 Transcript_133582/m.415408 type:complete len:99 (+) Transcript_133582:89-385(+)